MKRKGFTLIEVMISFAILGVICSLGFRLVGPISDFFRYGLARQKANSEARSCINTIGTAMRAGAANTVHLSTPNTPPVVSWSRIDFSLTAPLASGTTAYAIYLLNNAVWKVEYAPPNIVRGPQKLASNVSQLIFAPLDFRDPAIMEVSLRIDAPLNPREPDRVTTIVLNQEIHMLVNY